jgi:hypothetical protein
MGDQSGLALAFRVLGKAYKGADTATSDDGGNGTSADVASDATAGCEGGEDEGDVIERLFGLC